MFGVWQYHDLFFSLFLISFVILYPIIVLKPHLFNKILPPSLFHPEIINWEFEAFCHYCTNEATLLVHGTTSI